MDTRYHASFGDVDRSGVIAQNTGTANFSFNTTYQNEKEAWDRDKCLQALAFEDMDQRAYNISDATEGTCLWIFRHQAYVDWCISKGVLWIRGKPGSGKSTIMKSLLEQNTQTDQADPGSLDVSFFFHGRGSKLQKCALGLYRSILWQILRKGSNHQILQDFLSRFKPQVKDRGAPGASWHWHESELAKYIRKCLPDVLNQHRIRIFVDALDECGETEAVKIVRFFTDLRSTIPTNAQPLAICFSCRPYPHVLDPHQFDYNLTVEENNSGDIKSYLRQSISWNQLAQRDLDDMRNFLSDEARGVFQWVVLVVARLDGMHRNGRSTKTMSDEMKTIPRALNEFYREALDSTPSQDLAYTSRLFKWVCCALRPMELSMLRFAICVDPHNEYSSIDEITSADEFADNYGLLERRVKSLSRGLAEVIKNPGPPSKWVVQLVHQSVDDYLLSHGIFELEARLGLPITANILGSLHLELSCSCVRYMGVKETRKLDEGRLYQFSSQYREHRDIRTSELDEAIPQPQISALEAHGMEFLIYATVHWHHHAALAEKHIVPTADLRSSFCWPLNDTLQTWTHFQGVLVPNRSGIAVNIGSLAFGGDVTLLHVACRLGLLGLVGSIMSSSDQASLDEADDDGRTPLHYAVEGGHAAMTQLLLNVGKVNVNSRNQLTLDTPLLAAARGGHLPIVEMLLDHEGTNTNVKDWAGQDVLSIVHEGPAGGPSAELMLKRLGVCATSGAVRHRKDLMALHVAAEQNDLETATALFSTGLYPDSYLDHAGRTALFVAARSGNTAIVDLLLHAGADPLIRDNRRRYPLLDAIDSGVIATVEALISTVKLRSQPNVIDEHLSYNLHYTVSTGRVEAATKQNTDANVAILLAMGADHSITNEDGETPLFVAVDRDNKTIVASLLTAGANHSIANNDGLTPLHHAVELEHEDMVSILLAAGADHSITNNNGETPLFVAVDTNNETIVESLLSAGADLSLVSMSGDTSLHHAVDCEYHGIVTSLLAAGADHSLRNYVGATPLHLAAKTDSTIVASLLAAGADPSVIDDHGETPLFYAAFNSAEANVAILLAAGADPAIASHEYGDTPLHDVATSDDSMTDGCGDIHLDCVAVQKAKAIVESLIKAGLDPSVRNKYGVTPLHCAAVRNSAIVTILLAAGADPSLSNKLGDTPLHWVTNTTGTKTIIASLVAAGANPLKRNMYGYRPSERALMDACEAAGHKTIEEDLPTERLEIIELLRTAEANAIGRFNDDEHDDDDDEEGEGEDDGEDDDKDDEEKEDGGEDDEDDGLGEGEEDEDREKTSNDGDEHEDNQGNGEQVEEEKDQIGQNEKYGSNHDNEPHAILHTSQTRKRRNRHSTGSQSSQLADMTITKRPRIIEIEDD